MSLGNQFYIWHNGTLVGVSRSSAALRAVVLLLFAVPIGEVCSWNSG